MIPYSLSYSRSAFPKPAVYGRGKLGGEDFYPPGRRACKGFDPQNGILSPEE